MKTSMTSKLKWLPVAMIGALAFYSCDSDDDAVIPPPVNEEEVITTVEIRLDDNNGNVVNLRSIDDDGDGPNAPINTQDVDLLPNTTYTGTIEFYNDLESPRENITPEIRTEDLEHQVFYQVTNNFFTVSNLDQDVNGNDLGLSFTLTTGNSGSGVLTVTLIHEPVKPASTPAAAGGETDIEATIDVTVQ